MSYMRLANTTYSAHKKSWDSQALVHVWCYRIGLIIKNDIIMTLMCSYDIF